MNVRKDWILLGFLLLATCLSGAQEWIAQSRASIARHDLPAALAIVNERLSQTPNDYEALGWHARIRAWQGDWVTAEAEYRRVLEHAPNDTDILVGLADVLTWQQKYDQVLPVLDNAEKAGAPPSDVLKRRAHVLSAMGHTAEAKTAYRQLLLVDPSSAEAHAALTTTTEAPRYELRVGNDTDFFNYTDAANAQLISLRANWNSRWTTVFAATTYQRFGSDAEKFGTVASYKFTNHDWVSFGGAIGNKQDVISRYDENFGYGHGFSFRAGPVRGVENYVEQQSLWFTSSQVTLLRENALIYLPRDWTFNFGVGAARSSFQGAGSSWTPSGMTRLNFPLQRRLKGNVLFAVGSEDYANIDQIGRFAARTWGGGLRYQITGSQDISAYGAYQVRSQGRTQTSMGVNYGIRF